MQRFIDGGQLLDGGRRYPDIQRATKTGGRGVKTGGAIDPEDGDFAGIDGGRFADPTSDIR